MSINTGIETITPDTAQRWVAQSDQGNENIRRRRPRHVATLARMIDSGEWMVTGDAIKFDSEGKLMDGQHRLAAIVKAGKPVECLVVRGLDCSAAYAIDNHAKRTLSDYVTHAGYRNSTIVSATLRVWGNAIRPNAPLQKLMASVDLLASTRQCVELLDRSPDNFREAASITRSAVAECRGHRSGAIGFAWLAYATTYGRGAVEDFFAQLSPAGRRSNLSGPGSLFRDRVQKSIDLGSNIGRYPYAGLLLRALHAHVEGEEISRLFIPNKIIPIRSIEELDAIGWDAPDRISWALPSDIPPALRLAAPSDSADPAA